MKTTVSEQERIEAELIAARLFRFRARRGLGVFYSFISVLPLLGLILNATISPMAAVVGVVAGTFVIWFLARACGFGGFTLMQYNLDFLKGEGGAVYDERRGLRAFLRSNFLWFSASVWPWFVYTVAIVEGYRYFAATALVVLLAEWVLISRFSHPKENRILEGRVEDWAIGVGDVLIAAAAIIPGAPVWTWALASPLFVLCGTKSLYEAPKELAIVAS